MAHPQIPFKFPISDKQNYLENLSSEKVEEDLNAVLKEVTKIDHTCKFKSCKQKTNLMGSNCEFCTERFCFKHSFPEIHGCSDKVRKKEREEFLHPKVDTRSERAKQDHEKVQKKLDTKLKQMELERKQKPSGSGTGKSSKGKAKK